MIGEAHDGREQQTICDMSVERRETRLVKRSDGFTLIEMLIVIAILSVLVAILIPSLNRAKELARQAVCGSNLHQVGLALMAYVAQERGYIPMEADEFWSPPPPDTARNTPLILRDAGYVGLGVWSCPSDSRDTGKCLYTVNDAWCSYAANANHWVIGPPTPPWSWPQSGAYPAYWVRYPEIRRPSQVIWAYDGNGWSLSIASNAIDNLRVDLFLTYPEVYFGVFRHGRGPNILFTDDHVGMVVDLLDLEDPESWGIE